jgi:hypothetical protein
MGSTAYGYDLQMPFEATLAKQETCIFCLIYTEREGSILMMSVKYITKYWSIMRA